MRKTLAQNTTPSMGPASIEGMTREVAARVRSDIREPVKVIAGQMGVKGVDGTLLDGSGAGDEATGVREVIPAGRTARAAMSIDARGAVIRVESGFDAGPAA